jgi:opacity protein-like surface antigen
MKKFLILVGALLTVGAPASAQDCCQRVEIFGGYSYLDVSPKTDRIPADILGNRFDSRIGQNGFGVSVAGNFSRRFGIVADFSRNMSDNNILNLQTDTSTTLFLFGPRITSRNENVTVFGHALIGGMKRKAVSEVLNLSNTDLALGFGGGIDIGATKHIAVRLFQFDYIPSRGGDNMEGIGKRWSQNFRAQVGIVVRFGD